MLAPHDITQDYILGGRIVIRQPAQGYRVAIDPIFLASSIQALAGETILDVGCGVGAASLCLSLRLPQVKIIGLEIQQNMVRLASENIALNHMRPRIELLFADLMQPPPRLAAGTFSHVMANPPYLEETRGRKTYVNENKKTSHLESISLDQWAKFCLLMVRPKGTITFIHRADRLDHILSLFTGKVGDISVYPLWPGKDKPAKRILVRVTKNANSPMRLLPGMVLHDACGRYSKEAEHILRDGGGLEW
jgi:tRNA1(Val) A37 N6-methylase TrmN6